MMEIKNTLVGIPALALGLALSAGVSAQDAMFVDSTGNVGIGTNVPANALEVSRSDGTAKVAVIENSGTVAARELFQLSNNGGPFFIFTNRDIAQSYSFAMGATGDFLISHQQTAGVQFRVKPTGNVVIAGTLTEGSSREIKEEINAIDPATVLAKLDALSVSEWSYKGETGTRHLGPMAGDFYSAFGLGVDANHIAPKDLAGVALAAAQALKAENDRLRQEVRNLQELRSELEWVKSELVELKGGG